MPLMVVAFTVLLCIAFGANTVAIKIALSGLGVFTAAGSRFLIAATVITLWTRYAGRSLSVKKGQPAQLLFIGLLFTAQLSLIYLGMARTNASRGTLMINFQPFFLLIMAHFFIPGDTISLKKAMGIFMGFCGLMLTFTESSASLHGMHSGDLLMLAAAFLWAVNATYTKRVIGSYQAFQVVLFPMILSVPVFWAQAMAWDSPMVSDLSTPVLIALAYQGIVTASFGFVAWNTLLQRYGATSLHSFIFIMPVSGVLLGALLLKEPVTWKIVLSLLLIAAGIVVVHYKGVGRRQGREGATDALSGDGAAALEKPHDDRPCV